MRYFYLNCSSVQIISIGLTYENKVFSRPKMDTLEVHFAVTCETYDQMWVTKTGGFKLRNRAHVTFSYLCILAPSPPPVYNDAEHHSCITLHSSVTITVNSIMGS